MRKGRAVSCRRSGMEYVIYKNGQVIVYFMYKGKIVTDMNVDLETLACSTVEQLVVDLLNFGYKLNL